METVPSTSGREWDAMPQPILVFRGKNVARVDSESAWSQQDSSNVEWMQWWLDLVADGGRTFKVKVRKGGGGACHGCR